MPEEISIVDVYDKLVQIESDLKVSKFNIKVINMIIGAMAGKMLGIVDALFKSSTM
jgi:hypothetical protein